MLVVAGIPLLGYAAKRWIYDRYFGVHLDVKLFTSNGAYVQEIKLLPSAPPLVSQVAVWARVHIINRSASKVIITEMRAFEKNAEPRAIVANPVRSVRFAHGSEQPTGMIELPVTIESGDIWSAWVLLSVSIPAGFGSFLYDLYASDAEKSEPVRMFRHGFEEFRRQVMVDAQKGLEPILKIIDLNFGAVHVADPILRPEGDSIDSRLRMGRVPAHARGDVLPLLLKGGVPKPSEKSAGRFLIEAKTADRRTISYFIKTAGDPFWFFKREYRNTA